MLISIIKTKSLSKQNKLFPFLKMINSNFISYFKKFNQSLPHPVQDNPKQLIDKVKIQRENWAKLQNNKKKNLLQNFYLNIQKNKSNIADTITKATGKQLIASIQQVENGLKMLKSQLQHKHVKRIKVQDKGYGFGYYDKQPYGSILQIITHNSPFFTSCKYLISALNTNNSILFYPNKLAFPLSNMIQTIWKQTLQIKQEGQSQIINKNSLLIKNFEIYEEGKNSQNFDMLLETKDTGFISFTGTVSDGVRFYHHLASLSQNFAQSQFLLQSCDSCHVLEDLKNKPQKLRKCAKLIAKGAFSNGGTLPQSIKRLFIHPEVLEQFLPLLIEESKLYKFSLQNFENSNLSAILKSQYLSAKKALQEIQKLPQQFKLVLGSFKNTKIQSLEFNAQDFTIFQPAIVKIQAEYPSFAYQSQLYPIPILFIHPTNSMIQTIQFINSSIFGVNHTIFTQNQTIINDIQKIGSKIQVGTINVNNIQFHQKLPISPRKRSGKGFSNDLKCSNITRSKSVTF